MSVERDQLMDYLDTTLQPALFADYCPNGLQVSGGETIRKLATGVTACQALLDAAADWGADAILVHHGYFWKGEAPEVTGIKRNRLHTLLTNNMNLLAYHLPLDAHPALGNNARLGELMGLPLASHEPLEPGKAHSVGNVAQLADPQTMSVLLARLRDVTGRAPLHIGNEQRLVRRVAWCTGGAQSYIERAIGAGADVFVTGEASEQTVHIAREAGIEFVAAGHHATERYGVQALGEHLATKFALDYRYFDIDNPV